MDKQSANSEQQSALDALIKRRYKALAGRGEPLTGIERAVSIYGDEQAAAELTHYKAIEAAFEAAKNYIDVNVCDNDITPKMRQAWKKYTDALSALKDSQ